MSWTGATIARIITGKGSIDEVKELISDLSSTYNLELEMNVESTEEQELRMLNDDGRFYRGDEVDLELGRIEDEEEQID